MPRVAPFGVSIVSTQRKVLRNGKCCLIITYMRQRAKLKRVNPRALSAEKAIPADILTLKQVVGSQSGVAGILGVDRSSVTRWISGEDVPDAENAEKIVGLRYVITRLSKFLAPEAIHDWLQGINAHLRNQRPIDLLQNGRMTEVMSAIEQAEAGSYA